MTPIQNGMRLYHQSKTSSNYLEVLLLANDENLMHDLDLP